ncbi:MAG: HAMP domain-containing sensor histidine kinase, partial [Bacteroidota bacterium]
MRNRLSIFLMATSLALLAGFLILFLKKTWQEEVASLKKETGYLFVNSIHQIEGDLLDKMIFRKNSEDDSVQTFILRLPQPPKSADSVKTINFVGEEVIDKQWVGKEKFKISKDSGNVRVSIRQEMEQRHGDASMVGSLSMIVAMSDEEGGDSMLRQPLKRDILPLLEQNFSKAIADANLPVDYKILHWTSADSSLTPHPSSLSASYTDLASGEKYAAELSGYQGFIFRQMLPETLFSVALFACVALAFFTVFKNLQAQRRLTELKNDFIRNVTHELKTPIATVSVAIEALQDFDALRNPARTKEYLDISKNELNRLSLLVDKVLRMSLFEKAEPELKLESLDLKALVEEVLTSMKLQFEKAGAQVSFEADDGEFQLEGDRLHLASVVYNLLDNALKYSPVRPVVTVGLEQLDGHVYLRVADNGIGIPAEFKDKIFEQFFRIPTGDRHNVKGHGLGLSYVASVVQKHRGSIEMQSQPQVGTTFIIAFP